MAQVYPEPSHVLPSSLAKLEVPSIEKAIRWENLSCPRIKTKEGYEQLPHDFPCDEMGRFGVGILLYFKFLDKSILVFFLIMLLALPALFFNISAALNSYYLQIGSVSVQYLGLTAFSEDSINQFPSNLKNTSVFNFPIPAASGVAVDTRMAGFINSLFDVGYSIVFLLFIYKVYLDQKEEAEQANLENCTDADYTIRVNHLEPSFTDRAELRDFFEQWGQVNDVSIIYNDGNLLLLYNKRGELKTQLAGATMRQEIDEINEINTSLEELEIEIQQTKSELVRIPVCAFVTFEYQHSLKSCVSAYPNHWWQKLCCVNPRFKFRDEFVLDVSIAPEPSNILYHNFAYSRSSKRNRRIFTALCTILAISCSFFGLYGASIYRNNYVPKDADCPSFVEKAQTSNSTELLNCFCKQNVQFLITDSSLRELCTSWFSTYSISQGLFAVSAIIIGTINNVLIFICEKLVKFEKHSSRTSEELAMMTKVFLAMFVNTALVPFVINGDSSAFGNSLIGQGYYDLKTSWYTGVGQAVVIAMLVNVFNPNLLNLLLVPFTYLTRYCKRDKASTQIELNNLYSGKPFLLAPRYAYILNLIFVTFFYSGAIPLLLVFSWVAFVFTNYCDRVTLFQLASIPAKYDERMSEKAIYLMSFAVYVHNFMSIWYYTSATALTGYPVSSAISEKSSLLTGTFLSSSYATSFENRILNWSSFPNFLLFLVMTIFYVLIWFIDFISNFTCDCDNAKVAPLGEGSSMSKTQAKKKYRLSSYRVSDQEDYKNAFLRTDSLKQLPPINNIGQADNWLLERRESVVEEIENEAPRIVPASSFELNNKNQFLPDISTLYNGIVNMDLFSNKSESLEILQVQYGLLLENRFPRLGIQCSICYALFQIADVGTECSIVCPNCANTFIA